MPAENNGSATYNHLGTSCLHLIRCSSAQSRRLFLRNKTQIECPVTNVVDRTPVELLRESHREILGKPAHAAVEPRSNWSEELIVLAVFAGAMLYLSPLRDLLTFNADEGITLESADRILKGQIPYRDFFSFVTPGSYYLMAMCFKLFGTSFIVARSVLLLLNGGFAAATYWLARRSCGRPAALFAAALLTMGCLPARFFVLHNWDSTMLAVLAVCCAHKLLDKPSRGLSFFLGCAAALTLLTEQSKGAGLLLGLAIAALVFALPMRRGFRIPAGTLWTSSLGFAVPIALTFGYFAWHHSVQFMLQGWIWPLQHYSGTNKIFYGALLTNDELRNLYLSSSWGSLPFVVYFSAPMFLISLLALLVLGSTAFAVALRHGESPSQALDSRVLGGCIYSGIFLSTLATGRADFSHVIYLTPLFLYLVPSIFAFELRRGTPLFCKGQAIVAGVLLGSFLSYGLIKILPAMATTARIVSRRGVVKLNYADQVLDYAMKNVPEEAHLYVHPYQPSYSFMTATINPAHVLFLQAGMNTASQYADTITDLATDGPDFVLLNADFPIKVPIVWPATPAEVLATDPVADYIMQHYRTCRVLNSAKEQKWLFYFMVRDKLPCPAQR